jgi:5'-3' exonuclease
MQPLLDADVLVYEIGFGAEAGWKYEEQEGVPPFDYAANMLDNRIANICAIVGATKPPILFLTGKGNFRYHIAKRTPYKERAGNKPVHYKNIIAYIKGKYDWRLQEGLEADDLMAIEQTRVEEILNGNPFYSGPEVQTIICTRDKDLRSVAGWHYGWELGNQPQFGPALVTELGSIALSTDRKKIKGVGLRFFLSQCLTGDTVDSIPGLAGCGPVAAFKILDGTTTYKEGLNAVYRAYKASYGMYAYKELLEQGRLLWMTRKLKEDGSPYLWGQSI